jgi:hypothetical protein
MSEDAHLIDYSPLRKRGCCPCCGVNKNGTFLQCDCSDQICWTCQSCTLCCSTHQICWNHDNSRARLARKEIKMTADDSNFLKSMKVGW